MTDETRDRPAFCRKDAPLPPPRPGVRHVNLLLVNLVVIADDDLRGDRPLLAVAAAAGQRGCGEQGCEQSGPQRSHPMSHRSRLLPRLSASHRIVAIG